MPKQLSVTTDFYDNVLFSGRHFEKRHLDDLMAYCASLGATWHEWIVDTIWTLYDEDGPVGYDLLAEACEAAHRHGMRFDAVFKPFEGALDHPAHTFPSTFPRPAEAHFLDELGGIVDPVRPFLAEHPEMRMARLPQDAADPGGRIAAIRLVKSDDEPSPLEPEGISVWTSAYNGGWRRCDGPLSLSESVEERLLLPFRVQGCRIVTLEGLDLPPDTRFVLLRCEGGRGEFVNAVERAAELLDEQGRPIPSTPSRLRANTALLRDRAVALDKLGLTRYGRFPEVRQRLRDRERFLEEADGMFRFDFDACRGEVSLGSGEEVAVARGKQRHMGGVLCPAYPEVREHWLEHVRFCLERGVDGVGIRPGSHSWPFEPWAFGFNDPVLERCAHPGNAAEAARANSLAYEQFLREASAMVRGAGKEFGYHVSASFLRHVDRDPEKTGLIRNIDWEWQKWIREFADYVELRGITQLKRENALEVLDRVGLVAREAGVGLVFPGPPLRSDCEAEWFVEHSDVTAYMLYESANFTRINDSGAFEGDPKVAERARRFMKSRIST